jgi:hypothetical protein
LTADVLGHNLISCWWSTKIICKSLLPIRYKRKPKIQKVEIQ